MKQGLLWKVGSSLTDSKEVLSQLRAAGEYDDLGARSTPD
jgi:hypothetical protein